MATELATAYISLIPELRGAGKSIASQLGGVDVSPTGRKLGKSLSDGISSGIDSSGIKQLENAVANASQKVGRAMASENDATNQLKIAQQRLIEVRSKYAEGSSQVMAAEAKVESAQRKAAGTSERTKSAQVELKRAQEQLSAANKKVSSSSDDASRGIASMGKASGSVKGALGALTKVAGPILAAVGFSQLVGEAGRATDATKKFKSTLDFAGLGTPEIEALSKSTRKYADETVYGLSDIQNITAQLAANSVKDYDKLAEAAGNLNAVAGGNAETFSSVGMVLAQTAGAGKLTTENWNQLADAIPGASGKLQEAMLKNGAYTGNFRKAMEKGEITADEFNEALLQLGFEDAAVNAAKSTSTFEGAFGNLKAAAVGGLSDALAKVQPLVTGVINGIEPVVRGAFDFIGKGIDLFVKGVGKAGKYFGPLIEEIVGMVKENMPEIQAAWDGAMSAIKTVTETVWPIIDSVIQTVMGVIKGIISTGLAVIRGDWSGVWSGIRNIASSIWEGIKQIVSAGIEVAKNVIENVLNVIKGVWNGAWSSLKNFVGSIWDGIRQGVSNGIDSVLGFVRSLPGKITGIFSNAGSWLIDSGRSIINGLKDGITRGFEDAKRAVKNGLKAIRDFFPFSPAKKGPFSGHGWVLYSGMSIAEAMGAGFSDALPHALSRFDDGLTKLSSAASIDGTVSITSARAYDQTPVHATRGVTQNFTFNQPVKSPDEVARSVRMAERYGFAADY